ncbi:MAG: glycosyltransferase family 2 protein [Pseudomonadota bacterium]
MSATAAQNANGASGPAAPVEIDPAKVLVIFPMLNEARHAEAVLRQVIEGDPIASACPVVVADGGSADETRAIVTRLAAEFPNLSLADNPKRLQAAALNLALAPKHAEAEILIRCDAHAAYPPYYVSRLVASLTARETASVVVPMDAVAEEGCFQRGLAWVADTKLGAGGSAHRGGTASGYVDHGHHAAFRMEIFRQLGGYNETFRTNEDAEYDRRVLEAGGRIWLDADIRIGYFPRRSPGALWRQYLRYGEGRARTCHIHAVMPRLRQLIPVAHVGLLGLSLLMLPFGWLGWLWPAAYGALVIGTSVAVARARRSACGLMAGPAIAIMHTAWGIGFSLAMLRFTLTSPMRAAPGAAG